MPADDLAGPDQGRAEPVAQVEVAEVVEPGRHPGVVLGQRGPVHVVVHLDRHADDVVEQRPRVELVDHER